MADTMATWRKPTGFSDPAAYVYKVRILSYEGGNAICQIAGEKRPYKSKGLHSVPLSQLEPLPALVCTGCGSHWSDDELAAEKAANPALISCCPERRMVTPLEAAIREWCEGPADNVEELIAAAKKAVGE